MSSIVSSSTSPVSGVLRNVVRALILRRNEILMVRKQTPDGAGTRFALPGGGQRPGESLVHALSRECFEEIGTEVGVDSLVYVAEVEKPAPRGSLRHQVEFVFRCRVADDYLPQLGGYPDKHQVGVEWIGLQQLDQLDIRPAGMAPLIMQMAIGQGPVYVGKLVV